MKVAFGFLTTHTIDGVAHPKAHFIRLDQITAVGPLVGTYLRDDNMVRVRGFRVWFDGGPGQGIVCTDEHLHEDLPAQAARMEHHRVEFLAAWRAAHPWRGS